MGYSLCTTKPLDSKDLKSRECNAEAEAGPVQAEEDSGADMDYFDRQDLGKLRRRLRNAIESFQRERELYLELVQEFLEVPPPPPPVPSPYNPPATPNPIFHSHAQVIEKSQRKPRNCCRSS